MVDNGETFLQGYECLNVYWWASIQTGNSALAAFIVNGVRTHVTLADFGRYMDMYHMSPRNESTSMVIPDIGQFKILSTFESLASIPLAEI